MLVNQGPGIYLLNNMIIEEFIVDNNGVLSSKHFDLKLNNGSDIPVLRTDISLLSGQEFPSFGLKAKMLNDDFSISSRGWARTKLNKEAMEEVYLLHGGWCLYRDKYMRDEFYLFNPTGDFCYFLEQKEKGAKMVAPFGVKEAEKLSTGANEPTPLQKTLSFLKTVAGFGARTTAKLTNYFLVEPAWNVVQRALWSVRYIVMASIVGMSAYGFYNPSAALGLLKSMIPNVSIKVEAPEILK